MVNAGIWKGPRGAGGSGGGAAPSIGSDSSSSAGTSPPEDHSIIYSSKSVQYVQKYFHSLISFVLCLRYDVYDYFSVVPLIKLQVQEV